MLVLKILGAVAALAVGIWLGLPGRYAQTHEELEKRMTDGVHRRQKVKRHFTPLAWIQRKASARSSRPQGRRGFNLEPPDDR